MGQKIHPLSVRLSLNRNFDSMWFQEPSKYSHALMTDLRIRKFLKSLMESCGIDVGRISLSFYPKKTVLVCFVHQPKMQQNKKGLSGAVLQRIPAKVHSSQEKLSVQQKLPTAEHILATLRKFETFSSDKYKIDFLTAKSVQKTALKALQHVVVRRFLYQLTLNASKSQTVHLSLAGLQAAHQTAHVLHANHSENHTRVIKAPVGYSNYLESFLSSVSMTRTHLTEFKIESNFQSAVFLCLAVCRRLQEGASTRVIFQSLVQESAKYPMISGFRIMCAGRLGGVEMARTESKKYGMTSLHVFSSKIDYACDQALTLQGLIGVKVWISYRDVESTSAPKLHTEIHSMKKGESYVTAKTY